MLIVKTLLTLRSETNFDLFWKKARMRGAEWDVEGSQLPRRRKTQGGTKKGPVKEVFIQQLKVYIGKTTLKLSLVDLIKRDFVFTLVLSNSSLILHLEKGLNFLLCVSKTLKRVEVTVEGILDNINIQIIECVINI